MKSFAIVLFTLTLTTTAFAEVWLDVSLGSKHLNGSTYTTFNGTVKKFNETNTGIGLTWKVTDTKSVMVGTYTNSYFRQSNYIGANFHTANPTFNAGVAVGLITGYSLMTIMPMVLPNVSVLFHRRTKVTLALIPVSLVSDKGNSAITLQLSVKLSK